MNKYNNGKIYKIYNEDNLTYYGSTINKYISRRVGEHRSAKRLNPEKNVSSGLLGDDKKWKYELVELVPCNSKKELLEREMYYIKNFPCVNIKLPINSKKQYCIDHKEEKSEYDKKRFLKKTNCECGGVYRPNSKKRHEGSKKHIKYVNSL